MPAQRARLIEDSDVRSPGAVASGMSSSGYRIDDLLIDVGQQRVWRGDAELHLPDLSLKFLLALIREAPNVVTFDSLIESAWSGAVVSPEAVTQRVKLLREALGDDAHTPRYIGAVRGRGYRLLVPVAPLETPQAALSHQRARAGHPRVWRAAAALSAVTLLAAGAAVITQWRARDASAEGNTERTSLVVQPARTIAVLPFVNLSGDRENEYFSDGLSEELLNRLTLMPELHVAARTSSFHFKNKTEDVKKIGKMLGVRHVLEGSVRRQGDQVRVTAQLVGTEDGYRLWSSTFKRPVADVFAIQDEIAFAVAENLKLTLIAEEDAAPRRRLTATPEALDLYLRGRHLYQSWQLERIDKGIEYFKEAIRIDPRFAAAYVSQAEALFARSQNTLECCSPLEPWSDARRDLLRRAIELDAGNADAIASIGLDLMIARDFDGAARELHRAEAINPNGELVLRYLNYYYHSVGWPPERAIDYARRQFRLDPLNPLAAIGVSAAYWQSHQYEEALLAADRAIELDPNSWTAYWMRDAALIDLGRYEEAIAAAKKAVALSNGVANASADLVVAYAGAGRMDEARKLFDQVDDPNHKPRWRHAVRAYALAGLGEYEEAVTSLEHAYRENDGFLHEALHWKSFLPMHDDPRFQTLVRLLEQERRVQHTRDVNQARQVVAAVE